MLPNRRSRRNVSDLRCNWVDDRAGRWNTLGSPLIYTSEHYSTALLEKLVHGSGRLPPNQHYVQITIPSGTTYEILSQPTLPGWDSMPATVSKMFGEEWCLQRRSAILLVPSVVARPENNADQSCTSAVPAPHGEPASAGILSAACLVRSQVNLADMRMESAFITMQLVLDGAVIRPPAVLHAPSCARSHCSSSPPGPPICAAIAASPPARECRGWRLR